MYLLASVDTLERELRGSLQIVSRLLGRKRDHYLTRPLIPGIIVKRVYNSRRLFEQLNRHN